MKISTNCSPLVIYFGFFFPDKTITLAKGWGGWGGAGGGGGWGATGERSRRKGGNEGDRPRNRNALLLSSSTAFWGASLTHTPSLKRKKVDLFAEALSRFIRPPETAFESVYCEIHSSNLDKILTVY